MVWNSEQVVFFRRADTLLPGGDQEFLRGDEVDESEAGVEPVQILGQASIAHLDEAEALLGRRTAPPRADQHLAEYWLASRTSGHSRSLERQRRQVRSSACGAWVASTAAWP